MPTTENVLNGLAEDRATGALHLGGAGTLYLTGGHVTCAESPAAPRVEDLLAACGRISDHAVRQAMRAQDEGRPGGELLVAQGVLTKGELEFCVLGAVLDAVYFMFDAPGHRPWFRPGERHWLGPQWYFDVTGLFQECKRRRTQLDRTWPSAELDSLPVVPVGRVPAQRVVLTSLQWEVVACADSTATPADLAHRLGRPAYSVLLAVRQLAAAGLLRVPRGEIAAAPAPPGAPSETPEERPAAERRDARVPPEAPAGALPRRVAGVRGIRDAVAEGAHTSGTAQWLPPATGDPTDVNLLIRLRNALEALT
ncbi:hypothetical protein [Streptosporangium carneum]|uniref:MarR family transcriptional regulator n=1 Tax=Streptosporangium carneum TaxID=47481 RepID=A0A9W6IB12_9ACTN|nr:hypothetical protein [Streptosporangium carneum]GLK15361.1 hypothetical protein GCM10017600_87740 [Streptosporangium carneum]